MLLVDVDVEVLDEVELLVLVVLLVDVVEEVEPGGKTKLVSSQMTPVLYLLNLWRMKYLSDRFMFFAHHHRQRYSYLMNC